MEASRTPRFGLGISWPDDYTDYLVHFEEPFEVFRLELDQQGAMIFWVRSGSLFESMAEADFDGFVRAARKHLGVEQLVELGTMRPVELRVSEVPFPAVLMVSNRGEDFHAVVGFGDEPFVAVIGDDESEPLVAELTLGFDSDSPSVRTDLEGFVEAYYNEFYDRQDVLDKKNREPKGGGFRGRRGGETGYSLN